MVIVWPDKDPDEVLDYGLDWSARLGEADTISTSIWIIPDGIVKDSDTKTTTVTTIWLSGGSAGSFRLTNRVVTAAGRTMDQSVKLVVREK